MREDLQELFRYRELLYTLARRDVIVRYKQSIMGFMWAILMPVLIVLSGLVVRYAYAVAGHVPLRTADLTSVAVKSLPWAFLVSSIRFSCLSLTNNKDLVTKVYFPKEIFPLGSVLASLFDFMVASGALIIFLFLVQSGWSLYLIWIPFLILTMVILAAGIAMVVAAAGLFFRDVKYIVEVLLSFGIFFTPVFYDVAMFGNKGKWLFLNPVSPILDAFGACVSRHQAPDLRWLAYSVSFAALSLIGGYVFFKHVEPGFAESV
jgi:ABC-type polysaccharide/polyol phosphate export permease